MSRRAVLSTALPILALLSLTSAVGAQETTIQSGARATISQRSIVVYNVAGTITLRRGSGPLTVTATAQGPDGSQLQFISDTEGSRGRFRVVYPDVAQIASPDGQSHGTSDLDLRRDGTFGGDNDSGWSGRRGRGDRVRVGGSRGFRGYATIDITVPEGQQLVVHLVTGHVSADGVTGDVTIDTWGADAEGTNLAGDWLFDTGSGNATVHGMRGSLKFDTGSGDGSVSDMTGDVLDIDTGSGDAEAANVQVSRFRFDTGSGDVRATRLQARRGLIDTGSGKADIAFSGGTIDDLSIDTGSGRVSLTLPPNPDVRITMDTGSGDVVMQREGGVFERRDDDGTVIRFAQGRGRIKIDTGSGGVTIR